MGQCASCVSYDERRTRVRRSREDDMAAFDGVVLGFDFGEVRIGVAVGNALTASGRALRIVDGRTKKKWNDIAAIIAEWQPAALIVGLPRHKDGTPHEVTAKALKFARSLQGRTNLPVYMADERFTSVEAERRVNPGDALDAEAAAVIIEQWFMEGCPEKGPQDGI